MRKVQSLNCWLIWRLCAVNLLIVHTGIYAMLCIAAAADLINHCLQVNLQFCINLHHLPHLEAWGVGWLDLISNAIPNYSCSTGSRRHTGSSQEAAKG